MPSTRCGELPVVLAVGAWLKNAACRLDAGVPHFSPMHGDLGQPHACVALEESVAELLRDAPHGVAAVAHDLHPDFFSTRLALRLAQELAVPAIGVQHHHAHIAVVMAENGLRRPVIGLALDGYGLGTDGHAWGGELLRVQVGAWERLGHLSTLALPGADAAAREPWRMAAAALHGLGRSEEIEARFGSSVGLHAARGVYQLLQRGLNCPPTSSAGRWFDAAAAALRLSAKQAHEAEAAMAMQRCATRALDAGYSPLDVRVARVTASGDLDLLPLLGRLVDVPAAAVDEAAAWFHVALATALADWAGAAAQREGIDTVCLGGGCFCNAVLTHHVERQLQARGLRVLKPRRHSCGDAGLALGQAWVAATMLSTHAAANFHESLSCA